MNFFLAAKHCAASSNGVFYTQQGAFGKDALFGFGLTTYSLLGLGVVSQSILRLTISIAIIYSLVSDLFESSFIHLPHTLLICMVVESLLFFHICVV